MKSGKPNWIKIRTEYETSSISYRKLSEKYSVSFNTLKDRAIRELWSKGKEENHNKITTKSQQKIIEKFSDNILNDFSKELEASELLNNLILETLKDTKQFKKHLVQTKSKSGDIHTGIDESWDVEEKEFTVVDTKRLKDLATTLTANSGLRQTLKGFIPAAVREKLDIDNKSLEQKERELDNKIQSNKIIDNDKITINFSVPRPDKDDSK